MQKQPAGRFEIECRMFFKECGYRADGETVEEATQMLMAHARNDHGLNVTRDVAARARQAARQKPS